MTFTLPALELKVNEIYLSGSATNVDVIAGLTGINNSEKEFLITGLDRRALGKPKIPSLLFPR